MTLTPTSEAEYAEFIGTMMSFREHYMDRGLDADISDDVSHVVTLLNTKNLVDFNAYEVRAYYTTLERMKRQLEAIRTAKVPKDTPLIIAAVSLKKTMLESLYGGVESVTAEWHIPSTHETHRGLVHGRALVPTLLHLRNVGTPWVIGTVSTTTRQYGQPLSVRVLKPLTEDQERDIIASSQEFLDGKKLGSLR
ncbi:MAG: hypothetical protein E6R04_06825 [Spirochaetes bacterium]|nr:MAG: hypothetical protein E6R04_06825 [Spirochaetota bacterium]